MRVLKIVDNIVVSEKTVGENYELQDDEILSDTGRLGQIMQEDGTFITPEPEPIEPQETLEEKIDRLEQTIEINNFISLDIQLTLYEQILELQTQISGGN